MVAALAVAQTPTSPVKREPVVLANAAKAVTGDQANELRNPPDEVIRLLAAEYPHGIDIKVLRRIAALPGAYLRLRGLLLTRKAINTWENAVLALAMTGNPGAYSDLCAFLNRDDSDMASCHRNKLSNCDHKSPLTSPLVYFAKANVPVAMGLLLGEMNRRSDDAAPAAGDETLSVARVKVLRFLGKGSRVGLHAWSGIEWRTDYFGAGALSANDGVDEMDFSLSLKCIEGLGLSGDREARAHLDELDSGILPMVGEKTSFTPLVFGRVLGDPRNLELARSTVRKAIADHGVVVKSGLDALYSR